MENLVILFLEIGRVVICMATIDLHILFYSEGIIMIVFICLKQRSHQRSAESFMDHSQDTKNGSGPENNVLPSVVLSNVPNPVESDLEPATIYKAADYTTGLANSVALSNLRTEQNTFASVGNVVMPPQSLQESVPVAAENMVYQSNSQLWQGRPCITGSTLLNDTSEQNDLNIEGGSVSLSTAYSQG